MQPKRNKILFISHDATRTGAPIVFLHHLRGLKDKGLCFDILLKSGGELTAQFEKISKVYLFKRITNFLNRAINKVSKRNAYHDYLKGIFNNNYQIVYGNTVVSADLLQRAKQIDGKLTTVCHVHELDVAIKFFFGENNFRVAIPYIDHFVAASNAVKDVLLKVYEIPSSKITVHYEHIPLIPTSDDFSPSNKIPPAVLRICGSGTLDWRKGIDLFVMTAFLLKKNCPDDHFHFYWIGGDKNSPDYIKIQHDINTLGINDRITIIESCPDPSDYMRQCDVFLLTSREDPFPLVCLEAASLSKPIICFKQSGGMVEFVTDQTGWLVDYLDLPQLVNLLTELLLTDSIKQIETKGVAAQQRVRAFDIKIGVEKLHAYLNNISEHD